jgi:Protein of unknown function (DUF3299)
MSRSTPMIVSDKHLSSPAMVDQLAPPVSSEFQSVSRGAVMSVVLAILSLTSYLYAPFAAFALIAFVVGCVALVNIRRFPAELTGKAPATVGMFGGLAILLTSVGMHLYIRATEVPEGYRRIGWMELQPDLTNPNEIIPQRAIDMRDQKVFIKGYVYPGKSKKNLQNFILVRDFGTCCFGGTPQLTHMLEVNIQTDDRMDYSQRLCRIGGVLKIEPYLKKANDVGQVVYRIEADYIK